MHHLRCPGEATASVPPLQEGRVFERRLRQTYPPGRPVPSAG